MEGVDDRVGHRRVAGDHRQSGAAKISGAVGLGSKRLCSRDPGREEVAGDIRRLHHRRRHVGSHPRSDVAADIGAALRRSDVTLPGDVGSDLCWPVVHELDWICWVVRLAVRVWLEAGRASVSHQRFFHPK